MDISFIIPTVGRVDELRAVLQSILENTPKEYIYEAIIIDQNCDDRLDSIINDYRNYFEICHSKVSFKGVSRARNYGAMLSRGEFLNFPDDDSRILAGSVKLAIDLLNATEYKLVSGRSVDDNGKSTMTNFPMIPGDLDFSDFENKIIEYTFFARRSLVLDYPFDETLGPGCFHGCYEGFDLVYRMLKKGEPLFYMPEITFFHPQAVLDHSLPNTVRRSFTYRCGFSKSSLKHGLYGRILKRLALVLAYLPYCLLFKKHKTRFYLAEILGILTGVIVK